MYWADKMAAGLAPILSEHGHAYVHDSIMKGFGVLKSMLDPIYHERSRCKHTTSWYDAWICLMSQAIVPLGHTVILQLPQSLASIAFSHD